MWLEKDGNKIELDNPITIDAFKDNGYIEVKERVTPAPKPEKVEKPVKKSTKRTAKNVK